MNALRRYEALRPLDPNPLDSMGDVNLMAGRNAEAERLYLAAYKKNPSFLGGSDLYKAGVARLMTGDLAGAESIAKQGSGEMASRPEWLWISGRRKEAYEALATKAPRLTGDALAMANINLAIWAALLNDRASAARIAQQAAGVATQATAANFMLAKFLTLPPASATEWAVRADQVFPNAPPNSLKDLALADALLLNGHFAAAIPLLKQLEAVTPASGDRSLAIELAWALIETGKFNEAAPLLRWNPVPSVNGMTPLVGLYFPRLYRLRAAVAEHQGKADEARENRRIYAALGGQ
jgi:tetratricopeptide (TPR) repeat protein